MGKTMSGQLKLDRSLLALNALVVLEPSSCLRVSKSARRLSRAGPARAFGCPGKETPEGNLPAPVPGRSLFKDEWGMVMGHVSV